MIAVYLGKSDGQFTEGKEYPVQGCGDSIVILLDDNSLFAPLAYAELNNPKTWELKPAKA